MLVELYGLDHEELLAVRGLVAAPQTSRCGPAHRARVRNAGGGADGVGGAGPRVIDPIHGEGNIERPVLAAPSGPRPAEVIRFG